MAYFVQAAKVVEDKVEQFVTSHPKFQESLLEAFEALDADNSNTISFQEAVHGVSIMFERLQESLQREGIKVRNLTAQELKELFQAVDANRDGEMLIEEFKVFYVRILKHIAVQCATGFTQKYGLSMLCGAVGVFMVKRMIRSIPVVGALSSPLLGLIPSLIVGPVLGAAALYTYEKRDLLAIQKEFFPQKPNQFKAG